MTQKGYHILKWKEHIQYDWSSTAGFFSKRGEQTVTSSCYCISVILPPLICVKLRTSVDMSWRILVRDTIQLKMKKRQFRISSWSKWQILFFIHDVSKFLGFFPVRKKSMFQFYREAISYNFRIFSCLEKNHALLHRKYSLILFPLPLLVHGKITWEEV